MIGRLDQVKYDANEKRYRFSFENGFTLTVLQEALFYHTILRYEDDCLFFEFSNEEVFSGMIAYSLYETCGLPLEFAMDETNLHGIPLDEGGFHIMEELQRSRNKDTFKNRNAFE